MNTSRMENIAFRWLAYEKKCIAVLHERTPRYSAGQPDVIGVTKCRYLIEVEIKRSISDFRANQRKAHVRNREHYIKSQPKQFYFFVPEPIAEKCISELPPWAGLAIFKGDYNFNVTIQAPINNESRRLSIKECIKLFRNMTNQIVSFSNSIENHKIRLTEGVWDEFPLESRYPSEPIWSYMI